MPILTALIDDSDYYGPDVDNVMLNDDVDLDVQLKKYNEWTAEIKGLIGYKKFKDWLIENNLATEPTADDIKIFYYCA